MKKGFTLIEIMAVITIIGILALLIIPNIVESFKEASINTIKIQEKNIADAAVLFIEDACTHPIDEHYSRMCSDNEKVAFTYGDINNDNIIETADSLLLIRYINEVPQNISEKIAYSRGDTNLDGVINDEDIQNIQEYPMELKPLSFFPKKVFFCLNPLYENNYIKEDILFNGSTKCSGLVAFDKLNGKYLNPKTYLVCGEKYTTDKADYLVMPDRTMPLILCGV